MLSLSDVSKSYGGITALDGLDLQVPDDVYVTLLGASGSGKTTLLRVIAGFEEPDQGTVSLDGQRLDGVSPHERGIGFVFQNFALFPHLSVADNVAFGLRYRAEGAIEDSRKIDGRVADMLELVGLKGLGNRAVGAISGGQKQRVALARTLVADPKVVLLDEPLGALDANLRERMREELHTIRARLGVSFLHVTGSETEALTMGDQVAVLANGRIAQVAPPDELFGRPKSATVARHLNAYNILHGEHRGGQIRTPVGTLTPPSGARLAEGQDVAVALAYDGITAEPRSSMVSGGDGFPARFVAAEFNGPSILAFFRAKDGTLIHSLTHLSGPRPPELETDREYRLRFDPEDLITFSEGAA